LIIQLKSGLAASAALPRQNNKMSVVFSKTELAYIQGSREFTKEQARVLRYRINKKLKNQAKTDTDNQNQQLEHSLAVLGTAGNGFKFHPIHIFFIY
jgi:hypothetical protein